MPIVNMLFNMLCFFRCKELFIQYFAKEAHQKSLQSKRKTIQKKDLGRYIFLKNILKAMSPWYDLIKLPWDFFVK